ncbi:putative plectin, partial [Cyclospora cayetanensis]
MEGDPEFLSHLEQLGSEYKRLKEQRAAAQELAEALEARNSQLVKAHDELAGQRMELLAENTTLIEKLQMTSQEKAALQQQLTQQQEHIQTLQQQLSRQQAAVADAAAQHEAEVCRLQHDSDKAAAAAAAAEKELKKTQHAAAAYKTEAEDLHKQLMDTNNKLKQAIKNACSLSRF